VLAQEIHFAHDQYRCRRLYGLELARHSSHISSTLTLETLLSEIGTAVSRFTREHGADDLHHFLLLLARRLEERGRSDAVVQVLHYVESGDMSPATDMLAYARQRRTVVANEGTRTHAQTL
jgi:hypothetical protein